MSLTASYVERLTGTGLPIRLPVPDTRKQAMDWFREVMSYAESDPGRFKLEARLAMGTDLYLLALFMSCSQRLDVYTGRPEIDCDFMFEYARQWQFDSENVLDTSARGHWKSSWGSHVKPTQEIFRDPNITIALFSYQKQAAQRNLQRWMREMEQNKLLQFCWDDVLWAEPRKESAESWSLESGATVKRPIVSVSPTFGAYTFVRALPTGSRFSIQIYDDCETKETVKTEEVRAEIKEQFQNSMNLGGRGAPRSWASGTFHHPSALLNSMVQELGFRHRCYPAENVDLPAPDVASLYDELGGELPDGRVLDPQVRAIQLDGAPTFFHPLELADQRFRQGDRIYYMQNMGNPYKGEQKRFQLSWIERRYTGDPRELAEGANGYILSDPSKGIGDPTVNLVIAVLEDGTLALVDATRRKLSPAEYNEDMYRLCREWDHLVLPQQIRVEEYGQATWTFNIQTYFSRFAYDEWELMACSSRDPNRVREWARLEPLFRQGRFLLPNTLWVMGDDGRQFDFIRYFVEDEYLRFPLMAHDDVFAALALVEEPKAGPLRPPESSHWKRMEARLGNEWGDGEGGGDEDGWMTVGIT